MYGRVKGKCKLIWTLNHNLKLKMILKNCMTNDKLIELFINKILKAGCKFNFILK